MRRGTSVLVPEQRHTDFRMERERVLEEACVISRLDSPHIVDVHDAFLENNTAYIVMEYLEGAIAAGANRSARLPASG